MAGLGGLGCRLRGQVYRAGIRVEKEEEMLGSYAPQVRFGLRAQ